MQILAYDIDPLRNACFSRVYEHSQNIVSEPFQNFIRFTKCMRITKKKMTFFLIGS